jgi:3-hydroxyisobutyrate dehydrogenase-like beta-hydroxyacid dehydrogenase
VSAGLNICLIGFGEVGQILAADLAAGGARELTAWDVLFPVAGSSPARAVAGSAVRPAASAAAAASGAELVISAVTAARDIEAAAAVAAGMAPGTWFLDLNSVSPSVKQHAARLIGERHGRYVEAAVMAPVPPKRLATSMLLGGPHAGEFLPIARRLGFAGAQVFSQEIGRASAAKMCRSVLVKGMEALLAESLLAARRHGVDEAVLASMRDVLPATDWRAVARYMISRSLQHGARRAEEMREVARTLAEVGVEPSMSLACVDRQDWAAQHRDAAGAGTLEAMLDAILAAERESPE